jgi:hypothetical protein
MKPTKYRVFWTEGPAEAGVTPMQLTLVSAHDLKDAQNRVTHIEQILNRTECVHIHRTERV